MKRNKIKKAAHLLAGIIFIIFAVRMSASDELLTVFPAVLLGSLCIIAAGTHRQMVSFFRDSSLLLVFVEAAAMVCVLLFVMLPPAMFYLFLFATMAYAALASYLLITRRKIQRKSLPGSRTTSRRQSNMV